MNAWEKLTWTDPVLLERVHSGTELGKRLRNLGSSLAWAGFGAACEKQATERLRAEEESHAESLAMYRSALCVGVVLGLLVAPWAWPWWGLCAFVGVALTRLLP